jgi:hypothetical protein
MLNAMVVSFTGGTPSPRPPEMRDGRDGSEHTPLLNPEFVEALMGLPIGWTRTGDGG